MKTQTIIAQFLAIASTAAAHQYGNAVRRGLLPARRINGRAGTGPAGYVTVDDTVYGSPEGGIQVLAASSSPSMVLASEHIEGAYTSCVPVFVGATVPDCRAALSDIRLNNGTITVEGGTCRNWQEGTCLARVCARGLGTSYAQDAQWIADAIEESALDVCVAKGESGVVADCEDHAQACGTFRFWLQTYP